MNKQKKFSKHYAHELISIAEEDLASARDLQTMKTHRVENIFLLAQQSLEKGLKAVLCWNEQPIPFVHDIGILVTLLLPVAEPPFGYELNDLSEFAAIRRYQEGNEEFSEEEIESVLLKVTNALVWCQTRLKI